MSLRDFNSSEERPIILNTEPLGNGSGLGTFHTVSPEEREPNNTGKVVGALAVALMLGAGGLYAYTMTGKHPAPVQTAALPSAPAPQPAAMPAPEATPAPDTATPAAAPVPDATPAPVKNADAKPAKTHLARETVQPQAVIPDPVSPKAPASDIAANSTQAPSMPPTVTTPTNDNVATNTVQAPQETQSSTPKADNTAPAQDQQTGATPAPQPATPAQSSGQVQQ